MKRTALISALIFAAGLAGADQPYDEIAEVHAAGHWSGCVYQEGFAPYPIKISPRPAPTVKVEYPGLCTGYHTPRQKGWPNDAVEVITKDTGTCIETVELEYSFDEGMLRIDYLVDYSEAFALLVPSEEDSTPYTCDTSETAS